MSTAEAFDWDEVAERPKPTIKNGRYKIGDTTYTRATTLAGTLDDRHNLEKWGKRMVAQGLVARADLLAQVASVGDDKDKLNDLCEQALEAAKGTSGRNIGTALHTFTEKVDAGVDVTIPAPWDADVRAYTETLVASGVRVVDGMVERTVVNDKVQAAGTFDRLINVPGRPLPVVADLKTGNVAHSWVTISQQLAIYANADHMWTPGDVLEPMPPVDTEIGVVIHLPAGEAVCTIYTVDLVAGWEMAQTAAKVRKWRGLRNLAVTLDDYAANNTPPSRVDWLQSRIDTIKAHPAAVADLLKAWPQGVPTPKQGGLTDDHIDTIAAICDRVEAAHSFAFTDADPKTTPRWRIHHLNDAGKASVSALLAAAKWSNKVAHLSAAESSALVAACDLVDADLGDVLLAVWEQNPTATKFARCAKALLHGKAVLGFTDDGKPTITQPGRKQ